MHCVFRALQPAGCLAPAGLASAAWRRRGVTGCVRPARRKTSPSGSRAPMATAMSQPCTPYQSAGLAATAPRPVEKSSRKLPLHHTPRTPSHSGGAARTDGTQRPQNRGTREGAPARQHREPSAARRGGSAEHPCRRGQPSAREASWPNHGTPRWSSRTQGAWRGCAAAGGASPVLQAVVL